jgi:hypothetical protein
MRRRRVNGRALLACAGVLVGFGLAGCGSSEGDKSPGAALGADLADTVGFDEGGCTLQYPGDAWYCTVAHFSGSGESRRYLVDSDRSGCWTAWIGVERVLEYMRPARAGDTPSPDGQREGAVAVEQIEKVGSPVSGCTEEIRRAVPAGSSGGEIAPEQVPLPGSAVSTRRCANGSPPSPQTVPPAVLKDPRLRRLLCGRHLQLSTGGDGPS